MRGFDVLGLLMTSPEGHRPWAAPFILGVGLLWLLIAGLNVSSDRALHAMLWGIGGGLFLGRWIEMFKTVWREKTIERV